MKSAARTFDLFETFAKVQAPISLSELARQMKMPVSTCFNLVRTFEARGFLYSLGSRRGLYPTKRMLQLVTTIAQHDPVGTRVFHALSELRDKTGETVVLSKRHGDKVVYMEVFESSHRIRYSAAVGEIRDIHANFLKVGCDIVETNTFGATRTVLGEFGLQDRVAEINLAAVKLAKDVAQQFSSNGKPRFVAGSMGPTTKLPSLAHISFDDMVLAYEEQAAALIEGKNRL